MTSYILDGFWIVASSLAMKYDFSCLEQPFQEALPTLINTVPKEILQRMLEAPNERFSVPYVTISDKRYPERLKELKYPPPVLYYRGDINQLKRPAIAIVGTRHCSASARNITASFASVLSQKASIVSGLAYGIDQTAHLNSLPYTIGVCGQGLECKTYGYRKELHQTIINKGGLLLSEFHPQQPPRRWTYVQRNRIIAGLAEKLIVSEAPLRSGALISAHHALELGREVYAIPSHPHHRAGLGSLKLLQEGALFAVQPRDIENGLSTVNPENALLEYLQYRRTIVDIMDNSSKTYQQIHACLLMLLSQGLVEQKGPYWKAKT